MEMVDKPVNANEEGILVWRDMKIKQRLLSLGAGERVGQAPDSNPIKVMIARIEENSEHAIALFQSRDRNINYALITFAAIAVFVEAKVGTYGPRALAALGGFVMASFLWWEIRLHKYQHERRIVAARQFEELANAFDPTKGTFHLVMSVGLKSFLPLKEWFSPRRAFLFVLFVLSVAVPFVFSAFSHSP